MHGPRRYLSLLLLGLLLAQPVFGDGEQSLSEIDTLIRMRDYPQAVRRLEPLAAKGNPEALYRLAGLYRIGRGVGKNFDIAKSLYLEAAGAGHAEAQFALALLLEKSTGARSQVEAREWYRRAAAQGHQRAREKLAGMREPGEADIRNVSRTEIFDAIRHNDATLIESLIAGGVDLNLVDGQGNSTVMVALIAGWPGLAATLIRNTEWQPRSNALGDGPLHIAVVRDYRDVVAALLASRVNINQPDARGNSALLLAVRNQNVELVETLLENGADPGLRNQKGQSAVDLAYSPDHARIQAVFASRGIGPQPVQRADGDDELQRFAETARQKGSRYTGWPMLCLAIELGENGVSNRLIAERRGLEEAGPGGNRALHVAARKADSRSLKQLLAQGAEINARNRKNETPLYLAAESNCLDCVKLLLARGADPSIANSGGVTPLEIAVQNGGSRIGAALLATNTAYAGIHRVLFLAVENRLQALGRLLIPLDTELARLDDKRRSLLWHAADRGLQDTVAQLLATRKIDVNQRDTSGRDALAQAVAGGHLEIAGMLLAAGANLSTRTEEGNSLLILAVSAQRPEMVNYLLQRKVALDTRNSSGDTALILAAGNGQLRIVEMLIDAGADLKIRNNDDFNAFQVASHSGHEQIAKLIHDRSGLVFKIFN